LIHSKVKTIRQDKHDLRIERHLYEDKMAFERRDVKNQTIKVELNSVILAERQMRVEDIRNVDRKDLPNISF
jgi:hypothetical protein